MITEVVARLRARAHDDALMSASADEALQPAPRAVPPGDRFAMARAAAAALAAYDDKFTALDRRMDRLEGRMDVMNLKLNLLIAGVTLLGLPSLGLIWRVALKVGAL